ncbi:hypothetical protein KJ713_01750 [Patescibacteria group bacterium]|nr:hypothetical protein [Patescibacteria group bacterium]
MGTTETKYVVAVALDGLYEVVVASEGVKPYIGHNWLSGIDEAPEDDTFIGERLAVPEGTPENSVILIKGRPGGGPEKFRLFRFMGNQLIEMAPEGSVGGWGFNPADGWLNQFDGCLHQVSPENWGYIDIIECGWDIYQHFSGAMLAAGFAFSVDFLPPATSWRHYLEGFDRAIKGRQRAEMAETALHQIAEIVCGEDLLARSQRGALTSLVEAHQPARRSALDLVYILHEIFARCQTALPDLRLPDKYLKP